MLGGGLLWFIFAHTYLGNTESGKGTGELMELRATTSAQDTFQNIEVEK